MRIDREALREKVARAMAERDNWVWDKLSDEPQPWDDYNEGKNWWRDKADAALSALDQPAQEPVLWVSQATCDRLAAVTGYHGFVEVIARRVRDDKYTVPLYAAPQAAVAELRAENERLRQIVGSICISDMVGKMGWKSYKQAQEGLLAALSQKETSHDD